MRSDMVVYDKNGVSLPYSTRLLTVFITTIHHISVISIKTSCNTLYIREYYSGILLTFIVIVEKLRKF